MKTIKIFVAVIALSVVSFGSFAKNANSVGIDPGRG